MVYQLDFLVCPVVCHTVVDDHVEAIPPAPHVDGQGDGVADMDRPGDPRSRQAIARADFHEAFGRGEGEDYRVRSVGSVRGGRGVRVGWGEVGGLTKPGTG